MSLNSWIAYILVAVIGLALLGVFGDPSGRLFWYGLALILITVWWVLRRLHIAPGF